MSDVFMNSTIKLMGHTNLYNKSKTISFYREKQNITHISEIKFIQLLKELSQRQQWIFIMPNTKIPSCNILMEHGIYLNKLIRLKKSTTLNEQETIEKAKQLGTASAIISNQHCYYNNTSKWQVFTRHSTILH